MCVRKHEWPALRFRNAGFEGGFGEDLRRDNGSGLRHHLVEELLERRSERRQYSEIVLPWQIRYGVHKEAAAFERSDLKLIRAGCIHRNPRMRQGRQQVRVLKRFAVLFACDHKRKQAATALESEVYELAAMIPALVRQ